MNDKNWPDPKRPGVPMFPEQEGWHVIDARSGGSTVLTYWNGKEWSAGDCVRGLNSSPEWWRYNGAVLSATQINGMLAAERKRCAKAAQEIDMKYRKKWQTASIDADFIRGQSEGAYEAADAIRNLGAAP